MRTPLEILSGTLLEISGRTKPLNPKNFPLYWSLVNLQWTWHPSMLPLREREKNIQKLLQTPKKTVFFCCLGDLWSGNQSSGLLISIGVLGFYWARCFFILAFQACKERTTTTTTTATNFYCFCLLSCGSGSKWFCKKEWFLPPKCSPF